MTDRRDLVPGWESDHCVKPGYAFGRHPRWFRGGSPKIGPRPALQVDSTPLCLMRKKNLRVAIVFTRRLFPPASFLPPRSRDPFSFSLGALFLLPSCSFLASFVVVCRFAALFSSPVSLQSLLRFAVSSLVYSHFLALPIALLPTSARRAEISRPTRQLRVCRRLPRGISSRDPLAKFARRGERVVRSRSSQGPFTAAVTSLRVGDAPRRCLPSSSSARLCELSHFSERTSFSSSSFRAASHCVVFRDSLPNRALMGALEHRRSRARTADEALKGLFPQAP
jgi:hypothetical protein